MQLHLSAIKDCCFANMVDSVDSKSGPASMCVAQVFTPATSLLGALSVCIFGGFECLCFGGFEGCAVVLGFNV